MYIRRHSTRRWSSADDLLLLCCRHTVAVWHHLRYLCCCNSTWRYIDTNMSVHRCSGEAATVWWWWPMLCCCDDTWRPPATSVHTLYTNRPRFYISLEYRDSEVSGTKTGSEQSQYNCLNIIQACSLNRNGNWAHINIRLWKLHFLRHYRQKGHITVVGATVKTVQWTHWIYTLTHLQSSLDQPTWLPTSPGAEGGPVCNQMSPHFDSWSW